MRKLLLLACISYGLIGQAQIEMNTSGRVAIGNVSPASSVYELTTDDARFWGSTIMFDWDNQSICDLRISTEYNGLYYFKAIIPTANNQSRLGNSSSAYNSIYSYNIINPSDERLKENLRPLTNSLDIINSLNGVKYDLKTEIYRSENIDATPGFYEFVEKDRKDHVGFIAQDVMKVLPEVVQYDDSMDVYSMDYTKIIPVLVEAVKEQQKQIAQLSNKIKSNTYPFSVLEEDASTVQSGYLSEIELFQNAPNPFNESTEIEFKLPDEVKDAKLFIYDINGKQVKSYPINERGKGVVEINAYELEAGIFIYSMVADNNIISTKKMILTE